MDLTATHHTLPFNQLPEDEFEHLCLWLVDDSIEYIKVDYYGGPGDKGRDVVAYTSEDELDYYQCKRQRKITYNDLEQELNKIFRSIREKEIKQPRAIYFVTSSSVSPNAKDKSKAYAEKVGLPLPNFLEPPILHKKVIKDKDALKNFFNISDNKERESLPEVDVVGGILCSTNEYLFVVVNNGGIPAVDCSWCLLWFGDKYKVDQTFNLDPLEKKDLKISMPHDFMGKNPAKKLKLHFEYRDSKSNWYYSERLLEVVLAPSGAFYMIREKTGAYIPAKELNKG